MSHRPERLAEMIKKEVSDLLQNEIKDPRRGFVTVTGVEVSADLRYARIFVSVLGTPDEEKAAMEVLNRVQGYVRGELGRRIRLRCTPEITFKLDSSIARGTRVIELLHRVNRNREEAPHE